MAACYLSCCFHYDVDQHLDVCCICDSVDETADYDHTLDAQYEKVLAAEKRLVCVKHNTFSCNCMAMTGNLYLRWEE